MANDLQQAVRRLTTIMQQFEYPKAVYERGSYFTGTLHDALYECTNRVTVQDPLDVFAHTLARALTREGWYVFGAGHFAIVLGHEDYDGHAFKVSFKEQDAYAAYAMWARDNAGLSEHLPVIHHIERTDAFVVFALDELQQVYYDDFYAEGGLDELSSIAHGASDLDQYEIEENDLFFLAQRIGEFFRGAASIDIHNDNVMWDSEKCVYVITDPVSFTQ